MSARRPYATSWVALSTNLAEASPVSKGIGKPTTRYWRRLSVLGCVLLVGCGPEVGWQHARALPFAVRDGLQIAKGSQLSERRSLDLICNRAGTVHLLLHTRLPIPREFRRLGRDNDAVVFVDGIERRIPIVVDIVAITPVDEIVSTRLSNGDIQKLETSFGPSRPRRVSVVGIHETGVETRGASSGSSIDRFAKSCTGDVPAS